MSEEYRSSPIKLIDMVFPGDANHHGTLFGGVALAHMDKVAFLAASRHGRVAFVTASSEKIDFAAPARIGDMVAVTGHVVRVGRKSLDVEVELFAETPVSGERRLCTRGRFTLVAVRSSDLLPPLVEPASQDTGPSLRMVDIIFRTKRTTMARSMVAMPSHDGQGRVCASSRHARAVMMMAASDRIDFRSAIREGEMVELTANVRMTGRSSVRVAVDLRAEDLITSHRRHAATALFTMVSVDSNGRAKPIAEIAQLSMAGP